MTSMFEDAGWWAYALVFLAAATPVLEILVVIPAGVVAGLSPVPTAAVALAGNLATVALVAVLGEQLLDRWRRRRPVPGPAASDRARRAARLLQRWGVPGLAFLAPVTTGTHVATMAALAIGAQRRCVLRWMAAGLTVWAGVTATTVGAGLNLFA